MSIKDNVSEISENNVTIAENQQAVYEAGMRAGLAQDPDYAEGYDAGYSQGMTDSSGVVWDSLLNGDIPVGKARESDHALKSDHAFETDHAKTADNAANATNATTANRANEAAHAGEADHALEADHATEATHSGEADHAVNADQATHAERADFAGHATTASVANSANALNGVLSIENGGTGVNSFEQLMANILACQKPWDINENVGPIVATPADFTKEQTISSLGSWSVINEFTGSDGNYKTLLYKSLGFPSINSGAVSLRYTFTKRNASASVNTKGEEESIVLKVFINNNEVAHSDTYEIDNEHEISGIYQHQINVSKGDVISFGAECNVTDDDNVTRYFTSGDGFHDIYLEANIDTPYKYISLT